jgi:hypothetical protein
MGTATETIKKRLSLNWLLDFFSTFNILHCPIGILNKKQIFTSRAKTESIQQACLFRDG